MGETHGFRMGCNELFYLSERVHRTAEWVVKCFEWQTRMITWLTHPFEWIYWTTERVIKLFEWQTRTSEQLTHPFEWVYWTTERVVEFFEHLTQKGKWLTNQFERLIKISKPVPQMTERLTQTIISQNSRTSQEAVLFLLEWNFYCIISTITTVCEHASLFGTVIFPKTTSGKPLNSVKSFLKARCIELT